MQHPDFNVAEHRFMQALRHVTYRDARDVPKPWRDDPTAGRPRDLGFYIPTGNRALDAILANARPPILYGGDQSGVAAPTGNSQWAEFGSSWIIQPAPELFASEVERRAILAHELIHWTKEVGRAQRPVYGVSDNADIREGRIPPGYAQEELVAEIGAGLLLFACGADVDWHRVASYAGNWLTQIGPGPMERRRAIVEAMANAERAVEYLMQYAESVREAA